MVESTPLARYPVLDTQHVDEAEAALGTSLAPCRVHRVSDRSAFRVTLNSLRLGRASLVFNRYGAETHLETGIQDDTLYFAFGRRASSTFTGAGRALMAAPGRLIVPRPGSRQTVHRGDASELLVVKVSSHDLARHMRRLTGSDRADSLTFEPELPASEHGVRCLERLLRHLDEELADNESVMRHPALRRAYDEVVLTRLLALPHSLSRRLEGGKRHVPTPRLVRCAEDYLRENLARPVTLADVLDVVGCSRSVLYRAFRSVRGYTPMEFLTEERLQRARRELQRRDRASSVTDIALASGFTHLGRFAQSYARRFGERPSDTLRSTWS